MPISITTRAGDRAYMPIQVDGSDMTIHQRRLDATALDASRDADGYLPPGLGINAAGGPAHAAATTAVAVIGPEAVRKPTGVAIFANTIEAGVLNGNAIRDNVGAAIGATLPAQIKIL